MLLRQRLLGCSLIVLSLIAFGSVAHADMALPNPSAMMAAPAVPAVPALPGVTQSPTDAAKQTVVDTVKEKTAAAIGAPAAPASGIPAIPGVTQSPADAAKQAVVDKVTDKTAAAIGAPAQDTTPSLSSMPSIPSMGK